MHVRYLENLSDRAKDAFHFLAATTKTLPAGRYKQYGPLWQGGKNNPVMTAGARRNPLVLLK
eukprot:4404566-Heterocapsa_arctica.AAC.1